jgi:hypothetical protein
MQFAFRDSFPPGEAIAACGRCRTGGATGFQIQQNAKLKIVAIKQDLQKIKQYMYCAFETAVLK